MRLKFYSFLFLCFLLILQVFQPCKAQAVDTLRVLQYNLLHYGKEVYDCNDMNNSRDQKNTHLQTLLNYAQPDIFAVNEMDGQESDAQYLLDHALNVNGKTHYKRADFIGDYLVNTLYYNAEKLGLKHQDRIVTGTNQRDINVYHLYYKKNLIPGRDTTFLTCFVVHLKAGSENSSARLRARQTEMLMEYRADYNLAGNVLVMGDLNVYDSDEEAFQNLLYPMDMNLELNDPVNMQGEWHNSTESAAYHTQSTHGQGECVASGGLDDRFDFILMSNSIAKGQNRLQYLPNSYEVIGQDGHHLDKDLLDGENEKYDSELSQALYQVSDHLPVYMQLKVMDKISSTKRSLLVGERNVKFNNPVRRNLNLTINWGKAAHLRIEILSVIGTVVYRSQLKAMDGMQTHQIPFSSLESGMYLLKISDQNNHFLVKKVLKY